MTSVDGAAVALSGLAAVCLAVASSLQHRAVETVPVGNALDPRLVVEALRRPDWLLGAAATVLGVVLEAAALRAGPVSLVQPVLGLGLPMAVLLGPLLVGALPQPRDVLLAIGCAAGVSGLVLLAAPTGGAALPTTGGLVAMAGLCGAALLLAGRAPHGRGLPVALAAAVLLGTASVALRPVVDGMGRQSAGSEAPVTAVLLVAAAGALLTSQAAFQRVGLALSLSVVTLGEPVTAVLLAVGVLHERLHLHGVRGVLALSCGVLAMTATVGMARRSASSTYPSGADPAAVR